MLLAEGVPAHGAPDRGLGVAAVQGVEIHLRAVAEEVGHDAPVAVLQRGRLTAADPRFEAPRVPRQVELGSRSQPVDEVCEGVEAADAEDLVQLRKGVEVLRTRRAGRERRTRRELVDAETRPQLVEQEAHLRLGPDPDDTDAQGFAAVPAPDPVELHFKFGALEVVQRDRVDDALVGGSLCPLVHLQHELRANRVLDAVRAEAHQVLALRGIVRVVPVADVDEVDRIRGQAARPLDELGQRPCGRLRSEQAGRLRVADVQQVRQRIVRADRVDEVTLQALRDQDGRHLTPVASARDAAIATPTLDS